MKRLNKLRSVMLLAVLILSTAAYGPPACNSSDQPRTVADILVTAGSVKRSLRDANRADPAVGITAQQDYDISSRLATANRAYKAFITDELARLDAGGPQDPGARKAAINALVGSLRSIEDPAALGIKNPKSREVWRLAIAGLSTVIAGLEALGGA